MSAPDADLETRKSKRASATQFVPGSLKDEDDEEDEEDDDYQDSGESLVCLRCCYCSRQLQTSATMMRLLDQPRWDALTPHLERVHAGGCG